MPLKAIISTRTILFTCLLGGFMGPLPGLGQPVSIPMASTSPPPLPGVSIVLNTKAVSLSPIYSLFTSTATNCQLSACSPLPVTLLSFDGQRLDPGHVLLHWKTTNEINNAGFDVERSLGNSAQFETVGFVGAGPDSTLIKLYQFPDINSFPGTSYYRLKQLDVDSQFIYSKIIAIDNMAQPESLLLYPNPTTGLLNCKIIAAGSANAQIQICDMQGRIVLSEAAPVLKGANYLQFNVGRLTAGKYFLVVKRNDVAGSNMIGSFLKN